MGLFRIFIVLRSNELPRMGLITVFSNLILIGLWNSLLAQNIFQHLAKQDNSPEHNLGKSALT